MDFDASARNATAREVVFLGLDESNGAVDGGVNGEVAAHKSTWAGNLGCASLADENLASFDGLATKALYA